MIKLSRLFIITILALCSLFLISSCNKEESVNDGKIQIIASLFPQYDFIRQIAGDKANVTLLLPAGVESHMYDPTPSDMIKISESDLFVYTGELMEPWAADIMNSVKNNNLKVLDLSLFVSLEESDAHHHESEDEHDHGNESEDEHDHGNESEDEHDHEHTHEVDGISYDPHYWLDPENANKMILAITDLLCELDSENKDFYRNNANDYMNQLTELNNQYEEMIKNAKRNVVVFGDRFAMCYFVKHYNLDYVGVYDNCSSESEPSVQVLLNVINYIKENNIPIVYYEELSDPKVARQIQEETGVQLLMLHTAHNVDKTDKENNKTYLDIMRDNFENLKKGLN